MLNIKILTSFLHDDLLSFNYFCPPDLALACHGLDAFREIFHLNNFRPPPRFASSTSLLTDSVTSIPNFSLLHLICILQTLVATHVRLAGCFLVTK